MVVVTELENLFFGEALHGGAEKVEIKPERMISLTMAALDTSTQSDEFVPVHIYFSESNTHTLCTLSKKHAQFQQPLQLTLNAGETVSFFVKCKKGRVDLTGYYVSDHGFGSEQGYGDEQSEMERQQAAAHERFDDLSEGDSDDESDSDGQDDDDSDDEEIDDDDSDQDEDDGEGVTLGEMLGKISGGMGEVDSEDEDDDDEEDEDEDEDDEDDEDDDEDESGDDEELHEAIKRKMHKIQQESSSKKQKKAGPGDQTIPKLVPNAEVKKQEQKKAAPATSATATTKTLKGGVVAVENKIGSGTVATKGKPVQVYYTGKLKSGKKFDSCVKGKPFRFRLGSGEVIKGWDIGVEGMKVGGKRTLTIPPGMGYGSRAMGRDIPANSTLVFDVELKNVG